MKHLHHVPRGNLLTTGIGLRLAIAGAAAALLWAAVFWALAR